ncbi:MAG: 4Fe-4S dicluster domain-containing protein, partial [Deltaproteobacteria bacterium]|nr:4Fe-4S dicluster domain-containing protein [Candidatus Deferrimicrobiaceae bacterium]
MKEADYKELKKGGMMRQKEAGLFSVRLHVAGGMLTTVQLRAIHEAADRFGRGAVHLTSRQGVEIPFLPSGSLAAVKEFLALSGVGVGVCGPTVRTVTACQGCRVCPSGVIDSPAIAEAVDREYYGKPAPHKFKVGISGCANNCMKAEENDIGIKGYIEPHWSGEGCTFCRICETVCPSKAVRIPEDRRIVNIDLSGCIGCGDCIESCPAGAMAEGNRGFRLFAGGKFGRIPSLGRKIFGILRTPEEALAAIGAVIEFFRTHGKARERFGDTLHRTGFSALELHLKERMARFMKPLLDITGDACPMTFVKVRMGLSKIGPSGKLTVRLKEGALKNVISSLKAEGH